MPLQPIHHYSLENPASVYDEEALTALELVARLASKINEIIKHVTDQDKTVESELDEMREYILNAVKNWLADHPEDYATINDYVTPEMFGGVGDGETDSTEAIKLATLAGDVNLHGGTFVLSEGITLPSVIHNGTIIFTGSFGADIFNLFDGGGLHNVKVIIKTPDFAGNVVMVDYTKYSVQFNPMSFTIDGLTVDNTITEKFVDPSTVIRIRYHKYQVIYGQNITNVRLDGHMEYGIYIEPILRNTSDNPVFNTAVFSNIFFNACNCALKVYPILAEGNVEECGGGVGLYLLQFANQRKTPTQTKPFIDVHNTLLDGAMVIAWDYYADNVPESGIYRATGSSKVLFSRDYFPHNDNDAVIRYPWTVRSTGETYGNLYCTKLEDMNDDSPLRLGGKSNWVVSNMKAITFKPEKWNPYSELFTGLQFQRAQVIDSTGNKTVQIGTNGNDFYYRVFNKDTGWSKLSRIMAEGSTPQQYVGKRSAGQGVGDMRFDTTIKKPVWWNGTAWITADGATTLEVDYEIPE